MYKTTQRKIVENVEMKRTFSELDVGDTIKNKCNYQGRGT